MSAVDESNQPAGEAPGQPSQQGSPANREKPRSKPGRPSPREYFDQWEESGIVEVRGSRPRTRG